MPSPFTSSFASAAAGNAVADSSSTGRSAGSGDWSRARANGSTTTFRRPSGAPTSSQARDSVTDNPTPTQQSGGAAYIPPHLTSGAQSGNLRNGGPAESRYSKDQLLDMFRHLQDTRNAHREDFFVDGWNPNSVNGGSSGGWGKGDDSKDSGPEICWDHDGNVRPLALVPMSAEEQEIFATSVNSPLKPPTQNKETPNTPGVNRRTSITQGSTATSASRPSGRQRRDSSDPLQTGHGVSSPSNNRFSRDESALTSPPPSLLRRKTDYKETFGPSIEERETEVTDENKNIHDAMSQPGSLRRTNTNPLSSMNGPSSPWAGAPASASFAPMGAFGSFGALPTPTDKKPAFGGVRSESRFKSLMSGDSSEGSRKPHDPATLHRLSNPNTDSGRSAWDGNLSGAKKDLDEVHEHDEELRAGSAALGGEDVSPRVPFSATGRGVDRQTSYNDIGFSSLEIGSDLPYRDWSQRQQAPSQRTPHQTHVQPHQDEENSPAYTNPYQSPEADRSNTTDLNADSTDSRDDQHFQKGPSGRGFHQQLDLSSDRMQGHGAPPARGLSGYGGLSATSWMNAPGAIGTPGRTLGDSPFSGFGDMSTAALSGLGGGNFFGSNPGNIGTASGRSSKLGPLFPGGMQEHARTDPSKQDVGFNDEFDRSGGVNAPGFIGSSTRDNDSVSQMGNRLDSLLKGNDEHSRNITLTDTPHAINPIAAHAPFSATANNGNYFPSQDPDQTVSSQLPASQQRQMVMPDRMRWIYRDPQGNQQGPWSGLEMHDWYKAGFFSPELQVRKKEDNDYEPLAQLIRRIGNSREPFLVPQIGIPHGNAPSIAPSVGVAAAPATLPPVVSGSTQPPFPGSFPSFGTTLTAEQQNALERRKQEEQYLMARQKEHLAAMQPAMQRQMQQHLSGGLHNQQLQHHSSAHSLQSQPSHGSMTSLTGYQPSPGAGPIQSSSTSTGFSEGMPRSSGPFGTESLGPVRENDQSAYLDRMNLGRGAQGQTMSAPQGQDSNFHQAQVNAMLQDRARLAKEQSEFESRQRTGDDARNSAQRFEEYQQYRAMEDEKLRLQQLQHQVQKYGSASSKPENVPLEALSLSEQVQKAAAKQEPAGQTQSPWGRVQPGLPQPFPPPQSSSPMPAPTPQRNRQSVADALNAESQSQTPVRSESTDTPTAALAPWAKEPAEGAKGPSLKEIQAIEARRAAQQEELAAAARRAVAEQERLAQQSQSAAPAPGLPSSANWAKSSSPAVPVANEPSPWAKPTAGQTSTATPATGSTKKTLAQIQKEEEARKIRAAAAAAATANANAATTVSTTPGGKRYADLAGKATSATPLNPNNAAWTTVGASGKVKPAPGVPIRSASGNIASSNAAAPVAPKSKLVSSAAMKVTNSQQSANDEFQRWTKNALSKGLNSNISVDDFTSTLCSLPCEPDIISEAIYASSQTLDGRRFAEEFVKRRRLADKGVVPPSDGHSGFSSSNHVAESAKSSGNGGWSEVAKKGGVTGNSNDSQGSSNGQFRVVSGRKKGSKR